MRAIYVLIQSGYLSNQDLIKSLALFGYYPSKITPGLLHHKIIPIKFSVVVDYFKVKYVSKEDSQNLSDSIKANYSVKADWTGGNALELT